MSLIFELVKTFWILFPAYAANAFPVFANGKIPIDLGRKFIDNKRILGDGKTFEGFGLGMLVGMSVGFVEIILFPYLNTYSNEFGFSLPNMNLTVVFMICFGALVGDMIGSFIKRRLGMKRGEDAILLDQLDFVLGVLLFSYFFTEITIYMIIFMLILTPLIHRISCVIGYKLKLKKEPW